MATVADYITFADQAFELPEAAGFQTFPMSNLPANINSKMPGILTFMVEIHNGKGLNLVVGMGPANSPSSITYKFQYGWTVNYHFGSVQEVCVNAPLLNGNMLYFTRTAGTGTLKISDVVIWFQVNV
jgi:hypothetical protein